MGKFNHDFIPATFTRLWTYSRKKKKKKSFLSNYYNKTVVLDVLWSNKSLWTVQSSSFSSYKTKWNKTLKGLEQFRKQTPFSSIVPPPCWGYFSMHSMGSTLWLLITYPFKLPPPETFFSSLLYLCRSVSTYQQLQPGASSPGRSGSSKFLPVAQHTNTPLFFAAQALYCSFIDWEVLCCSGINSWGDPNPTISLSVRPLRLKGGEAA